MKKILLFSFLLIFILSACNSPAPTEAPKSTNAPEQEVVEEVEVEPEETIWRKAQDGKPLRFPHWMQQHPVMKLMTAGFLQACEDYGMLCQLDGIEGDDDAAVVAAIESMTTENTSGIVTGMFFPSRYAAGLVAIERGIPVVSQHVSATQEDVPGLLAWAAPDVEEYAESSGKAMAKKLECEGPVALTQTGLNDAQNRLIEGFREALVKECPDIEVLESQPLGLDVPKAISLVVGIIQANPDLKGAISADGNGPTVWSSAARESGKEPGEIVIVSMDYTRPNLDLVKSGDVYMLIGQPLYEESYWATVLLANYLLDLPVPYENIMPAPLVTLENVDQFYAINDLAESRGE